VAEVKSIDVAHYKAVLSRLGRHEIDLLFAICDVCHHVSLFSEVSDT
jgi:hypothetical protein